MFDRLPGRLGNEDLRNGRSHIGVFMPWIVISRAVSGALIGGKPRQQLPLFPSSTGPITLPFDSDPFCVASDKYLLGPLVASSRSHSLGVPIPRIPGG